MVFLTMLASVNCRIQQVKEIKKQINYARDNSVDDALDYHAIWNSALISSSDMESAMKAYVEKVSGDFEDLEPKKSFWEKQGLIS